MMAKNDDIDNSILFFIGGKPLTLKDIGPAADMRIDAAMQSILDQGLLGPQYVGVPWHTVIKSSGLALEKEPEGDAVLQNVLYEPYKAQLDHCRELSREDNLQQGDRDKLTALRKRWQTAEKLRKA